MNGMLIVWLAVLVAAIAVEAGTLGLTSIWFAGGALVALVAAALKWPVAVQVVIFFLVAIALLIFTRPVAVKYFNRQRVKTNAEGLVGRQAVVTAEIDNLRSMGQVIVGGQEWSARTKDPDFKPELGAVVKIAAIDGVKLIVEAEEEK